VVDLDHSARADWTEIDAMAGEDRDALAIVGRLDGGRRLGDIRRAANAC
jgi:hypothetical protein